MYLSILIKHRLGRGGGGINEGRKQTEGTRSCFLGSALAGAAEIILLPLLPLLLRAAPVEVRTEQLKLRKNAPPSSP